MWPIRSLVTGGRQRVIDFVYGSSRGGFRDIARFNNRDGSQLFAPGGVPTKAASFIFLPVLKDPIMEPKYVRHLASFHPLFQAGGDNVIEIPQCGHLAMVEQPDAVATLIRSILSQH